MALLSDGGFAGWFEMRSVSGCSELGRLNYSAQSSCWFFRWWQTSGAALQNFCCVQMYRPQSSDAAAGNIRSDAGATTACGK